MKRIIAVIATIIISVSLMGQENKLFHWGVDASVDGFLSTNNTILPSFGGSSSYFVQVFLRIEDYFD